MCFHKDEFFSKHYIGIRIIMDRGSTSVRTLTLGNSNFSFIVFKECRDFKWRVLNSPEGKANIQLLRK